jgi:trans-aconitate methyltransferase
LIDLLDPQPGERILDAGCGSGELTNSIAERGATGIGFDFDPSMVKRAQEQFPKLTFFQADASNFQVLEEEGGPVDAIFSNAALHWVRDADGAAASMSKALKPGGRFVVEFGGKGNVQRIVEATLETMNRSMTTDSPWYFPSVGEYSSILEKHGIEVTSAALYDRPTVLEEGDEGLSNWLRMFGGAFFRDMSDEQVNNALTTVNHKLRPHLWDGTQWTADYRRIRIIGKKL